jgi:hypothetical protein
MHLIEVLLQSGAKTISAMKIIELEEPLRGSRIR